MTKIYKIDNLEIIEKDNNKICKKINKDPNILNKYNYLKSKDFLYYPNETILKDNYEIRNYIDEIEINAEDKINELLNIIILLHTNTTFYKELKLTDIKDYYEKETNDIIDLKKYYESIFDNNMYYLYLKPSISLLIRKISIILISLDKSKYYLDMWYKIIKDKKKQRVVFNHNNLKLSNYIKGNKSILINWNNSIFDYQINDLYSLFRNNYEYISMKDSFDRYNLKYPLYEEEKYLLFFKLLKCNKVLLNKSEIINTKEVFDIIKYLEKVNMFLDNYMTN